MKNFRYAIQRKSDKKVYKNPAAIYFTVESYWDNDVSKARLWLYKPEFADENLYTILTFKLVAVKNP